MKRYYVCILWNLSFILCLILKFVFDLIVNDNWVTFIRIDLCSDLHCILNYYMWKYDVNCMRAYYDYI